MIVLRKSKLDYFASYAIGIKPDIESLRKYQLAAINDTFRYVKVNSRFYKDWNLPKLYSLKDMDKIHTTSSKDLKNNSIEDFISVPIEEIERIVTIMTSGSTGSPKRIGYTLSEIESIVDFFARGMYELTEASKRVLIFMPGQAEYGVSNLLKKACEKIGTHVEIYGTIKDFIDAKEKVLSFKPHCIAGIPIQILGLSEYLKGLNTNIESALLSADFLSNAARKRIESNIGCTVFNHYGTTEMGFGAALECDAHDGLHLREGEIYFEIIDEKTEKGVEDGEEGELVFTTFSRKGVPLIRYRTGDYTKVIQEKCRCGSFLRKINAPYRKEGIISMPELDEALFSIDDIIDFSVEWNKSKGEIIVCLWTYLDREIQFEKVHNALLNILNRVGASLRVYKMSSDKVSPCKMGKRLINITCDLNKME